MSAAPHAHLSIGIQCDICRRIDKYRALICPELIRVHVPIQCNGICLRRSKLPDLGNRHILADHHVLPIFIEQVHILEIDRDASSDRRIDNDILGPLQIDFARPLGCFNVLEDFDNNGIDRCAVHRLERGLERRISLNKRIIPVIKDGLVRPADGQRIGGVGVGVGIVSGDVARGDSRGRNVLENAALNLAAFVEGNIGANN